MALLARGDAEAGGHGDRPFARVDRDFCEGGPEPLRDDGGLLKAAIGSNEEELFAAMPPEGVVPADLFQPSGREGLQNRVSGPVTVGIVDALEVIHVREDDRDRTASSLHLGELLLERFVECPSVLDVGERIVERLPLESGLGVEQLILQLDDAPAGSQTDFELARIKGLLDEVVGAGGQCVDELPLSLAGREQDHVNVGGVGTGAQQAAHVDAAEAGHLPVEDGQARGVLAQQGGEGGATVVDRGHFVTPAARHSGELPESERLVVGEEQARPAVRTEGAAPRRLVRPRRDRRSADSRIGDRIAQRGVQVLRTLAHIVHNGRGRETLKPLSAILPAFAGAPRRFFLNDSADFLEGGGITSPRGFTAGAVYAGIKSYGPEPRRDVGLLVSDRAAAVAGVFTTNRIVGAPVELCRERVAGGVGRGIVVNSGISNVAMGEQGRRDARRMTAVAAEHLGVPAEEMFVASTGVIGRPLPMDRIEAGIARIRATPDGGEDFSRAMMTTDTVPKQRAVRFVAGDRTYVVGGAAKGAGMAHPDMATVLCFLTTDAPASAIWLREAIREVADVSLNMFDVDMDTSTSDTMLVFAGGAAGGDPIGSGHPAEGALRGALEVVAIALARDLARDGEGARTLIEVVVRAARSVQDARRAARTVVSSPLVKTMVTGRDPNLGRVMMALGRSGAEVDVDRTSIWIGGECAFERGAPATTSYEVLSGAMATDTVRIVVDLGMGDATATAWGCDLTEEYIRINADYTT